MKRTFSPNLTGILLALAAFSLFSLGDAVIKALSARYDTFTLSFYIGAFVLLLTLLAAPFRGGVRAILSTPDRKWHIARGALLTLQFLLTIYAFSLMPLAKVYALLFMAPLLTALLAWPLLGERTSVRQGALILAGFAGVLLILRPGVIPVDLASMGMLLAAVCFAGANIIVRFMRHATQPLLAWPFFSETQVLVASLPFFLQHPVLPATPDLLLLGLIAAMSVAALICLGLAFRIGETTVVAPFHYVQMLWAVMLGYLLFGNVMDGWMAAGAAMIVGSGLLLIHENGRRVPAL
jgi:drug/metabolite transporter (DMT)-like permease